jgi:hypothetical protein
MKTQKFDFGSVIKWNGFNIPKKCAHITNFKIVELLLSF